jgi:phosphate butyryltransferase
MVLTSFDQLNELVKTSGSLRRMVIAVAADEHSLEAAFHARRGGLVHVVAVGDKAGIQKILDKLGEQIPEGDIYDEADAEKACALAVSLVREGKGDFLMKGKIDTGILLKAVVNKENGLGKGCIMSHFTIFEIPGYHKLLTAVDGGMVPYPTLEQKKSIIENTVNTLHAISYTKPKVGVLACMEKVNPKMPETVDAAALQKMSEAGEISGCVVNGPISYDCAVSKEIAYFKDYTGEVAGDVDVLVAPNIHAGNIMGKMLTCTCGAKMAGIIVGAQCPIVLTSRGSSAEEKYLSIMLSAVVSVERRIK